MSSSGLTLAPGSHFNGRYEIVRRIGSGGMGAVYEVVHLDTQRRRAMKVMLPQLVANDALRTRFKQEATVVANVESQHIVEITDAGVDDETGSPFIVMELLKGQDLQQLLEAEGRMAPPRLMPLLRQAALALDRTHSQGIVHRDLKPENLFVTQRDDGTPHVKVLDFGIAKVVADSMRENKQTATVGTPMYMAPEQIRSKDMIGPQTDIYALAHVAYTLLVGEPYFAEDADRATNPYQLMVTVAEGVTEPASERARRTSNVELSAAVAAWFAKATSLEPASRYSSAGQLVDALEHAVASGDGPSEGKGLTDPSMATADLMSVMESGAPIEPVPKTELGEPPISATIASVDSKRFAAAAATGASTTGGASTDSTPEARKRSRAPIFAGLALLLIAGGVTGWRNLAEDSSKLLKATAALGTPLDTLRVAGCPAGMVLVARATYKMGDDGASEGDGPAHPVTAGPLCIDRTEVTVAAYKTCVDAGACEQITTVAWPKISPADQARFDPLCNYGKADRMTHPVNCMAWSHAEAFCKHAGKRLPTEAEWELAARGAQGNIYPWGTADPSPLLVNACGRECRAHFARGAGSWKVMYEHDDKWPITSPAGSLPAGASPCGALDMAGNVLEWVADWHAPYSKDAVVNPAVTTKPAGAAEPRRILRGGSFFSFSGANVDASHRVATLPDKRTASSGIRCAAPVQLTRP